MLKVFFIKKLELDADPYKEWWVRETDVTPQRDNSLLGSFLRPNVTSFSVSPIVTPDLDSNIPLIGCWIRPRASRFALTDETLFYSKGALNGTSEATVIMQRCNRDPSLYGPSSSADWRLSPDPSPNKQPIGGTLFMWVLGIRMGALMWVSGCESTETHHRSSLMVHKYIYLEALKSGLRVDAKQTRTNTKTHYSLFSKMHMFYSIFGPVSVPI